jgi:hypothetical protein
MKKIAILKFLLLFSILINAQKSKIIKIDNRSFEDYPQPSHTPNGWYDCGYEGETPPDIQPNIIIKVENEPEDGETFLALVTRDNHTIEAIGQKLKSELRNDTCYEFRISLAHSQNYLNMSRLTGKDANYNSPVALFIWGGNKYCSVKELLAKTPPINHTNWRRYKFIIKPKINLQYIMLAAAYPKDEKTNGNLLLDNATHFVPCKCDEKTENK